MLTPHAEVLLERLSAIAHAGPIVAIGHGSTSVGMTLLDRLGVDHTSTQKPKFMGIVVTARRELPTTPRNRVNLFAKVPDWNRSACKSSAEIVDRYGYDTGAGVRKLYCTVRAQNPNSQGLFLSLNPASQTVDEMAAVSTGSVHVASWCLEDLCSRLINSHPESMWVSASVIRQGGREYFQYRKAVYTGLPIANRFPRLLDQGTVTIDHLIEKRAQKTSEKGPLFKILPSNLPMLFPTSPVFDLLT
jgi:hypothetical protein